MPNKLYSYKQIASTTATRLDQIVQLYDGAIKFMMLAGDDIKKNDAASKSEHLNRALAIVDYLRAILDLEKGGKVAILLDQLYEYATHEMLQASAWMDATRLDGPLRSLRELRSAWYEIATSPGAPAKTEAPVEMVTSVQIPSSVRFHA